MTDINEKIFKSTLPVKYFFTQILIERFYSSVSTLSRNNQLFFFEIIEFEISDLGFHFILLHFASF